jgi:hypothetical protein
VECNITIFKNINDNRSPEWVLNKETQETLYTEHRTKTKKTTQKAKTLSDTDPPKIQG